MSIGYKTHDSGMEQTARGRVRRILDYELKEFSYAAHQAVANPLAVAHSVKSKRAAAQKAMGEGADAAGGALVPDDDADDGDAVTCPDCGAAADAGDAYCASCGAKLPARSADDEAAEGEQASGGKTAGADELTEVKAVWSAKYVNDLNDSAFLFIEAGGVKDEEGKTTPRSLRHFPVKDADGKVDLAHLRDAIGRIPQSNAKGLDKTALQARARRMLETADGGKVYEEDAEWKAGVPISVRALGYRLLDLSEQLATEHKAMALLGEDTKEQMRILPEVRAQVAAVAADITRLVDWAQAIEKGEDGARQVDYLQQQLALLSL